MKITMISHSCLLIEVAGRTILTDPWMTEPLYFGRLFHRFGVGMAIKDLPPIDLILASHGHDDHLDPHTLGELDPDTPLAVWHKAATKARRAGMRQVTPMRPGDRLDVGDVRVHACVGCHPGGLVTFVVESDGEVLFFGGDTAWDNGFTDVARRFPRLDVALLPVSGVCLFWGLAAVHMNAVESARLAHLLGARTVIPIHYHFDVRHIPAVLGPTFDVAHTADEFVSIAPWVCPDAEVVKLGVGETWHQSTEHRNDDAD
jgi:L-ascorbate metabolism protein UlaG (beta-lactamase superfamily)